MTSLLWLDARGDQLQLPANRSIAARAAHESYPKVKCRGRIGTAASATSAAESRHVRQTPHSMSVVAARATALVLSRAPTPCRVQHSGCSGNEYNVYYSIITKYKVNTSTINK